MHKNTCIRVLADPVQIRQCRQKIDENKKSFEVISNVLALGGNQARLKILYLLEEEGELCPCDISDILGMTVPAISQHLRKLKDGNIIEARKVGQTIFYSLRKENLKLLRPFFKAIEEKEFKTISL
ncbi:MAG: ArsR/SmtB family transcription factor [Cyclobacteriaceae bacterium]